MSKRLEDYKISGDIFKDRKELFELYSLDEINARLKELTYKDSTEPGVSYYMQILNFSKYNCSYETKRNDEGL